MLAKLKTFKLVGIEALPVEVKNDRSRLHDRDKFVGRDGGHAQLIKVAGVSCHKVIGGDARCGSSLDCVLKIASRKSEGPIDHEFIERDNLK